MVRKILLSLFVVLGVAFTASAQNKQISGSVTDSTGEPVIGAAVIVEGTSIGTTSGSDGSFTLDAPANGTLNVSFIGLQSQQVEIAGKTNFAITLVEDATIMDAVIVTAMGISRSEKTLGYSATSIGGEEVSLARNTNVMNNLQGKVAGLSISSTSSQPGAANSVVIRGFSSINGNNQPLYIVDGVPLQDNTLTSSLSQTTISTGGIANIPADNIENMTVLKGAAATALYGSRAANGVIVITTKSGKKENGKNFTIEYNGGIQLREVAYLPEMQNEFGQGWNGAYTYIENGSWGPALDGSTQVYGPIYDKSQLIAEYSAVENNVKDFFDIGVSYNHSISLSGVSESEDMTYFMSYSNTSEDGMLPTDADSYKRNTISFKGTYDPVKWLKVSSAISVATSQTSVVGTYQGTSVIDGLYEMPRNISIVDMSDTSSAFNTPEAYYTPYGITNPYWALENNYDTTDSKQVFGKLQFDVMPTDKITLTYRYGFDYNDYDWKLGYPEIALDDALINEDYGYAPSNMNQTGAVAAQYVRKYEINNDFLATYVDEFGALDFSATAGININERSSTSLYATTSGLTIETGWWDLSNGSSYDSILESQSLRRLVGAFADFTFGYDDFLYLGITARNDWSSTLPAGSNSFFYPGATLSYIFTEKLPKSDVLSFGKVRLAYGMTGNDADPYLTSTAYSQASADGYYGSSIAAFPMNSTNAFQSSTTAGSDSLRPEITTEFEIGANIQLFGGRLGFDVAYYDRVTDDQIFTLPVDPSTGYSYMVTNFGEVSNKGYEIMVNTTPIQTKNVRWDVDVTFAKNKNTVLSLPESLEGGKVVINSYAAGNDAVYMYAEEGKAIGQFYTYMPTYVTDESSEYYGCQIVDEYGQPVLSSDVEDTGLDVNPDWTGGITSTLTVKNFTLSATLDVSYGGTMFSRTKNLMQFTGNGIQTTYNNRDPFVIPGSVVSNGDGTYSENTTAIMHSDGSYQEYYDTYGNGEGGLAYLIDRSYAKVRNISLGYTLPKSTVSQLGLSDVYVSVFVNNAFMWTASDNSYIDPEVSTEGTDLSGSFGEMYAYPSSRIYGFNIGVKF
ncbi:MAG: SusC/RagA family TonB-linked outer membrane protein [Rikenellaceae bacterium]